MATYTSKEVRSTGGSTYFRLLVSNSFTTDNKVNISISLQARRINSGYYTWDHTGKGTYTISYRPNASSAWTTKTYNWKDVEKISSSSWTTYKTFSNYATYACNASGYFLGQFAFSSSSSVENLTIANTPLIFFSTTSGANTYVVQNTSATTTIRDTGSKYEMVDDSHFNYVLNLSSNNQAKNWQISVDNSAWQTISTAPSTALRKVLSFGAGKTYSKLDKMYAVKVRAYNNITGKVSNTLSYTVDAYKCFISSGTTNPAIYSSGLATVTANFNLTASSQWVIYRLDKSLWTNISSGNQQPAGGTESTGPIVKQFSLTPGVPTSFKIYAKRNLNGIGSYMVYDVLTTDPDMNIYRKSIERLKSTFVINSNVTISSYRYSVVEMGSTPSYSDTWLPVGNNTIDLTINKEDRNIGTIYELYVQTKIDLGGGSTKIITKSIKLKFYGAISVCTQAGDGSAVYKPAGCYVCTGTDVQGKAIWQICDPYVCTETEPLTWTLTKG